MGFYNKYEKALAKHGYTVDDRGCVTDAQGNQAAAEDAYGNVQCKDPNVTEICRKAETSLASKAKAAVKKVTAKKKAEKGLEILDKLEDGD